jgi:hypothetical protein
MKVGDLVTMEPELQGAIEFSGVGIVVNATIRPHRNRDRVAVFWSDAGCGLEWEPIDWLVVLSASR